MTNLDSKHLDALMAELDRRANDRYSDKARTFRIADADKMKKAADTITALRAQIDQERAATIEAAAEASDCGCVKDMSDCMAKRGVVSYCYREGAADIRALHTDATRAAMDAIRREGYEAGVRDERAAIAHRLGTITSYQTEVKVVCGCGQRQTATTDVQCSASEVSAIMRSLADIIPPDPDTIPR